MGQLPGQQRPYSTQAGPLGGTVDHNKQISGWKFILWFYGDERVLLGKQRNKGTNGTAGKASKIRGGCLFSDW